MALVKIGLLVGGEATTVQLAPSGIEPGEVAELGAQAFYLKAVEAAVAFAL